MKELSQVELKTIRGGFIAWSTGMLAGWLASRLSREDESDARSGGTSGGGGASLTY